MGMICTLCTQIEDPKARLEMIFAEAAKSKELSMPLKQLMPLVTESVALGTPMGIQMLSLLYSRSNLANVLPPRSMSRSRMSSGPRSHSMRMVPNSCIPIRSRS